MKTERAELPEDVEAYLAEVEGRVNKATPPPWKIEYDDGWDDDPNDTTYAVRSLGPFDYVEHKDLSDPNGNQDEADAQFAANARIDVPRLIAIVREQGARYDANLHEISETYIRSMQRVEGERDELRKRLTKLEVAARKFHMTPFGEDAHTEAWRELGAVLDDKGDT